MGYLGTLSSLQTSHVYSTCSVDVSSYLVIHRQVLVSYRISIVFSSGYYELNELEIVKTFFCHLKIFSEIISFAQKFSLSEFESTNSFFVHSWKYIA